jgi:hypothetical protein
MSQGVPAEREAAARVQKYELRTNSECWRQAPVEGMAPTALQMAEMTANVDPRSQNALAERMTPTKLQ